MRGDEDGDFVGASWREDKGGERIRGIKGVEVFRGSVGSKARLTHSGTALEQAQLAQAAATAGTSSDGDHVPFADDDASLEASKMLALHHYAVAALCSDAPPPLHPPASPSPHTSASSSTSSTSSSATSSPAPAASRAAGSGDAELSRIVEMLAAAGMPIPC